MQNAFTHWWSTKPWDPITGFSEYEYRMYSPELGRWTSRDPIEEVGGENLYQFIGNYRYNLDYYGLLPLDITIEPVQRVKTAEIRGYGSVNIENMKLVCGCSGVCCRLDCKWEGSIPLKILDDESLASHPNRTTGTKIPSYRSVRVHEFQHISNAFGMARKVLADIDGLLKCYYNKYDCENAINRVKEIENNERGKFNKTQGDEYFESGIGTHHEVGWESQYVKYLEADDETYIVKELN
jgi:RHS repeat-associated protein